MKCPQCGALNTIPPVGLQMTCEYCGLTRDVPDIQKRRKRQEKEERRRQEAEERQRQEAEHRREEQADRRRQASAGRRRSVLSGLSRLLGTLFTLGIIGFVLYQVGLLEPLFGDTGRRELDLAAAELRDKGYSPWGAPAEERFFSGPASLFVNAEIGHCYGVAVGAGKPITQLKLLSRRVVRQRPDHYRGTLVHCPNRPGMLRVMVTLKGPGRFTWAVLRRPSRNVDKPTRRRSGRARPGRRQARPRKRRRARPRPPRKHRPQANEPPRVDPVQDPIEPELDEPIEP